MSEIAAVVDREQPPLAFQRRLPLLVHKLGEEVMERATEGLAELGLDGRAFVVLAVLADDRPGSQLELARMIGRVPGLIVGVIDELEQAGLVARRRSETDRRRTVVELTDRGRRVLAQGDALSARIEQAMFGALGDEQRAALHEALGAALRATWTPC